MKIILLRGLPGSGKSTYAKKTWPGAIICSADHLFESPDGYHFDPSRIDLAHKLCFKRYVEAIRDQEYIRLRGEEPNQNQIVVDNTNISAWELSPYLMVAKIHDFECDIWNFPVSVETALQRNVHGVAERTIRSMAERLEKDELPPFWTQWDVV